MKKRINSNFIVWVDVDEVLLRFRDMFNIYLANVHKIDVTPDFVSSDWAYSDVIPKEMTFNEIFGGLPSNWTQEQKVYKGAYRFLKKLKSLDAYVVLITHVPQEQSHFRIENLVNHKLYYDEIYFTGSSKTVFSEQILKRFHPNKGKKIFNFFIDDRAKNVVEFLKNMPNVVYAVTLDLPYNQSDIKEGLQFKKKFDFSATTQNEMYERLLEAIFQFKMAPPRGRRPKKS